MKTYRNLYPQVTNFINLYVAFRKARKGKRHRPAVAEFEYNLEANLLPFSVRGCPEIREMISSRRDACV